MILYINKKGEVRDVNTTTDTSLTPVEVTEASGLFVGWSVAKICCHKVTAKEGRVTGYTPCVDPKIIEHIDRLAKQNGECDANIASLQETVDVLVLESLGF